MFARVIKKTQAAAPDPVMEAQLAREAERERRERAAHSSPEDLRAMDTTDSPEIFHMPKELADNQEKETEYLREHYEVKPEPQLGHPVKGVEQPNAEQKSITKEGDALHGYHGG